MALGEKGEKSEKGGLTRPQLFARTIFRAHTQPQGVRFRVSGVREDKHKS